MLVVVAVYGTLFGLISVTALSIPSLVTMIPGGVALSARDV